MTEAEWLACADLSWMVITLRWRQLQERLFRLCACACCRLMWHNLTEPQWKAAVELAERFADGEEIEDDLGEAHEPVSIGPRGPHPTRAVQLDQLSPAERVDWAAAQVAESVTRHEDGWHFSHHLEDIIENTLIMAEYQAFGLKREVVAGTIVNILRDTFATAFRPVPFDRNSLTSEVIALARAAYEHRTLPSGHLDPARLAILSDALEEAGGSDADILAHLRSPGTHVRGCWAVDLICGRS